MKKLPKDIADLFNKSKPLSQEELDQLKKAAEELDNDPEFMKEYQEDLQKELDLSRKNQYPANTMNTDTDLDKTPLTALIVGIIVGMLFGSSLIHYFSTEPLREEAIKRGYASYVLKDPFKCNSAEFVWK